MWKEVTVCGWWMLKAIFGRNGDWRVLVRFLNLGFGSVSTERFNGQNLSITSRLSGPLRWITKKGMLFRYYAQHGRMMEALSFQLGVTSRQRCGLYCQEGSLCKWACMMRLLRTLLGFLKWIYWLQAAGTKLSSKSFLMQILTVIFAWDLQWLHIVSMEISASTF